MPVSKGNRPYANLLQIILTVYGDYDNIYTC
jgi:hypothetical protein